MRLILRKEHLLLLEREARRVYPQEACALLFGRGKGVDRIVEDVFITQNEEGSTIRFAVNSEFFYKIYRMMEDKGKEYLGVFHSHPAKPYPSRIDEEGMKNWPGIIWLIYSSIDKKFSAYLMEEGYNIRSVRVVSV